jgi:hypothetical protein
MSGEPHDLESLIDRVLEHCPDGGRITVADMMDALGDRSFGPLLLLPSLVAVSPVGAIPGLPAVTSAIEVVLIVQMLMGHDHFWIPQWLARRSVDGHKLAAGLKKFRPLMVFFDHTLLRPRLAWLTTGPFLYIIALLSLAVALITPILELIPLGGIPPNAAVAAFALAITARDGLWAVIAGLFTVGSTVLLVMSL